MTYLKSLIILKWVQQNIFWFNQKETFLANFHINQEMNFWALLDVRDSFKDLEKGRPNSEDNGIIKFLFVCFVN